MNMWQRIKNIQIPGSIVTGSLMGAILGTTTVLFTVLPVRPPSVNTLEGSTSFQNESLEVVIKLESGEELQVRVTGATTMEVVQSLKRILQNMDGTILTEKSSHYIQLLEE